MRRGWIMLSPCLHRINDPDTTSDTHMQDHIYNSTSASASPTAARASSARTLDSLISYVQGA